MKLTSPAFTQGEMIPSKYTCDGDNINPELSIEDVPENASSLVLIMDDPDIPQQVKQRMRIDVFDHWVLFNIDPKITLIKENSAPGMQGANTRGNSVYTGPCPPPQFMPKIHRYFFKLYALDFVLPVQEGATKEQVEKAMQGHILEQVQLIGRYSRE